MAPAADLAIDMPSVESMCLCQNSSDWILWRMWSNRGFTIDRYEVVWFYGVSGVALGHATNALAAFGLPAVILTFDQCVVGCPARKPEETTVTTQRM